MRVTDQYQIEERGLIHLHKFGVPRLEVVIRGGGGGRTVLGLAPGSSLDVLHAVLDDLGKDLSVDVGERNPVVGAVVFDHVPDGPGLQCNRQVHLEGLLV